MDVVSLTEEELCVVKAISENKAIIDEQLRRNDSSVGVAAKLLSELQTALAKHTGRRVSVLRDGSVSFDKFVPDDIVRNSLHDEVGRVTRVQHGDIWSVKVVVINDAKKDVRAASWHPDDCTVVG